MLAQKQTVNERQDIVNSKNEILYNVRTKYHSFNVQLGVSLAIQNIKM